MSTIGGIYLFNKNSSCAESLVKMSRALCTARDKTAYLSRGVGLLCSNTRYTLPRTEKSTGRTFTLVADEWGFDSQIDKLSSLLPPSDSSALPCGEFAVAAYDGSAHCLSVLRDKQGSRPVYFLSSKDHTAFCSEIKGLLAICDAQPTVSVEALKRHIFYSYSVLPTEIYSGLTEPPAGKLTLLSGDSINFIDICYKTTNKEQSEAKNITDPEFFYPDEQGLEELLKKLLLSFDLPQFDVHMPSFLNALNEIRISSRELAIADPTVCIDIGYSTRRRERLCSMAGVYAECVPPSNCRICDGNLIKFESTVANILYSHGTDSISDLFGKDWESALRREKNRSRRIRAYGMLYQTSIWCNSYPLKFI